MIKTIERAEKAKKRARYVPTHEDPARELRHLVTQHRNLTRNAVSLDHMHKPKTAREDCPERGWVKGQEIPIAIPDDAAMELAEVADSMRRHASGLESRMLNNLRKIPIYKHFLADVFGFGPVVCAYIAASVDPYRCEKPSQLKRYCGMAVIGGRLERPQAGQRRGYNADMRTRLYQAFASMWKNAARLHATTKYMTIWTDYKHRMEHSDRLRGTKIVIDMGETEREVSAKGFAHSTGWHKAADVFLEDLYTIWRTLEGLPVWPSYHAAKLGYEHGGRICVQAPRLLTLDEAKDVVGHVGKIVIEEHAEAAE